jgi:hypothetical protein
VTWAPRVPSILTSLAAFFPPRFDIATSLQHKFFRAVIDSSAQSHNPGWGVGHLSHHQPLHRILALIAAKSEALAACP